VTTTSAVRLTANDRLKHGFDKTLALSLVLATSLHVLLFQLAPAMSAPSWGTAEEVAVEVVRLEKYETPQAPQRLMRPAAPVAVANVPADATIEPVDFREYAELPPPPVDAATTESGAMEAFTPYTVAPRLLNPQDVQRALERAYPPALRDAGLGGTVSLLVHVGEDGAVLGERVGETSGFGPIDQAALGLTSIMRFSPAMNRDVRVAVWIQIPLTFQVR